MTRRYYMTFLFNQIVDEFIKAVFSEMKITHSIFKKARQKIMKSYKKWKIATLTKTAEFIQKWIQSIKFKMSSHKISLDTYKNIKQKLAKDFSIDWLKFLFNFANVTINFEQILEKEIRFVKCTLSL